MYNPGMRRKGGNLAGHAIIEARADGNNQVTVGHGHVGTVGAVHPQHTE